MRVLARPISSQNIDNNKISTKLQDSSVINNNINTDGHSCLEQATLLSKSRDGESDSSSDDSSRPTEEQLQSIADRMGAQVCDLLDFTLKVLTLVIRFRFPPFLDFLTTFVYTTRTSSLRTIFAMFAPSA